MAMHDFTIIRRSLNARLFSTVTTVLMVAVAVALILVLLSMSEAGEKAFQRGKGNMHLIASRDPGQMVAVLNGVFYANPPQDYLFWHDFLALKDRFPQFGDPGNPERFSRGYAIAIQQGDSYKGFPVVATEREFFTLYSSDPQVAPSEDGSVIWEFASGEPFDASFEVVLGANVAEATGHVLGDEIEFTHGAGRNVQGEDAHAHTHQHFAYTVVGILEKTGGPHDHALFTDLTSTWILHAHDRREREEPHNHDLATTESDLLNMDKRITGIYLRGATRAGSQVTSGLQGAQDALRRDEISLTVAEPTTQMNALFRIVSNINLIFVGMAIVVMISSGIAILLALYNSMEQRRRQIAVLRVLGSSRGHIFGLVVTESAVIGVLGALAGLAGAFGGAILVAAVLRNKLGLVVEPDLDWMWILVVIAGTIVLSGLAGLIPAFMAYRTPVVRNLRPIG